MAGEKDLWKFYKDKKGEWRWRRTASNGNIVGASTEGYKSKKAAINNATRAPFDPATSKLTPDSEPL